MAIATNGSIYRRGDMSEQELKLHVPHESHQAIARPLERGKSTTIQMRALYFDTPTRELVGARIALRLRLEGTQWVQTLKMPGQHSLSRLEINQDRPDATLDLSIYDGTPAGEVLSHLKQPLNVCYETDVHRLLKETRTKAGVVEIAFDRGWIKAGALLLPLSEVEFELKRGRLAAVFDLGRRWQKRFGLVLDFRSKAERGDRLAQLAQTLQLLEARAITDERAKQQLAAERAKHVADFWNPRGSQAVSMQESTRLQEASHSLAMVMSECLEQIVRNAAFLCEVDTAGICKMANPEHVHQLRVGIRRLRSAWSFFDGMTELPSPELRQATTQHFSLLGSTRDNDVLRDFIVPLLEKAGLPPLIWPDAVSADEGTELVRTTAFQGWLLDLLEFSVTAADSRIPPTPLQTTPQPPLDALQSGAQQDFIFPRAVKEPPLKPLLIKKLNKWHRQIIKDGLTFLELEIECQHALRKKCKRLRYAMQFCESLLPSAVLAPYRKQLAATQDILGEMNDLYVAGPLFAELRQTQPQAWFASGWISARLQVLSLEAAQSFKALASTQPPWK